MLWSNDLLVSSSERILSEIFDVWRVITFSDLLASLLSSDRPTEFGIRFEKLRPLFPVLDLEELTLLTRLRFFAAVTRSTT